MGKVIWTFRSNAGKFGRFFEDHIIDRNRRDIKELLRYHGLDFYDPELIARISYGRTCDYYWMRFDDENITLEEIKGYDYRENR